MKGFNIGFELMVVLVVAIIVAGVTLREIFG
jgi:hypothetical protein